MNKNIDWFNLLGSYFLFAFIYSAVIWVTWNYLFASIFNLPFTYLQILGGYTILRLLFGNTNTNYISNFYSPKSMDLNKIDDYLKDMETRLNSQENDLEQEEYRFFNKKDKEDTDKKD